MVSDAAQIRQKIGAATDPKSKALQWTELHDALTSMRSHKKDIPEALRAHDLDIVDKWARINLHIAHADFTKGPSSLTLKVATHGLLTST